MQLFQVGIKKTASSAKVTAYYPMPELARVKKELVELKDSGEIYYFEVMV
jgi:hypothetical protein